MQIRNRQQGSVQADSNEEPMPKQPSQPIPGIAAGVPRQYDSYEIAFRSHHKTHTTLGPYEHYRLVYRYGYELGTDTRYIGVVWANVVRAARPRWEERNPGTWDQFEPMIQYAWKASQPPSA
jgi:hypothetical protein